MKFQKNQGTGKLSKLFLSAITALLFVAVDTCYVAGRWFTHAWYFFAGQAAHECKGLCYLAKNNSTIPH